MSKPIKDMLTRELTERYAALDNALLVELVGADGVTTNQFRRELRNRRMRLEIVKNALFRRALASAPLARLAEAMTGPCALITGGESVTDAAKLVEEWQPKLAGLKLKGALLDGELVGRGQVDQLSRMPTKRDMQSRIAALALAPGGKLAAAVLSGGGRIAACLKTIIERHEKGEDAAAAPAA
jgi:large subunit ribosomal protein L10